nr:hypothetical protein [Mycobacterium sp. E3298]
MFDGTPEQKEEFGVQSKEDSEYGYEIGDIIDDTGIASKYCPFCNGIEVSDDDLLNYLLKKYDINKQELETEYLSSRNR